MLSPTLLRLDARNHSIGDLDLADAFFTPSEITGPGIQPYLRGLCRQVPQEIGYYLAPKTTFAEITSNLKLQAKLAASYLTPDDIDVWVGALAEDHVPGALVGELVSTVLKDQFTRLRDGDRFWYRSYLPQTLILRLERQNLTTTIRRNTTINTELQHNVFVLGGGF